MISFKFLRKNKDYDVLPKGYLVTTTIMGNCETKFFYRHHEVTKYLKKISKINPKISNLSVRWES